MCSSHNCNSLPRKRNDRSGGAAQRNVCSLLPGENALVTPSGGWHDPCLTVTMTEHPTPRETVVSTGAELQDAVTELPPDEAMGSILVAPAALRAMEHISFFGTVIMSPAGPSIETISMGSFHGQWEDARSTVLLRRSLQPFRRDRIQVLAVDPQDHEFTIRVFVATNGYAGASIPREQRFLKSIPEGIVVPPSGTHLMPHLRMAFRHLFHHAALDYQHPAHMVHEAHRGAIQESYAFARWWNRVTEPAGQNALYTAVHEGWMSTIRKSPHEADPGWEREPGEFHAWWRLFAPG